MSKDNNFEAIDASVVWQDEHSFVIEVTMIDNNKDGKLIACSHSFSKNDIYDR